MCRSISSSEEFILELTCANFSVDDVEITDSWVIKNKPVTRTEGFISIPSIGKSLLLVQITDSKLRSYHVITVHSWKNTITMMIC